VEKIAKGSVEPLAILIGLVDYAASAWFYGMKKISFILNDFACSECVT
jgi:hypothetical protein